ncbi:MAG: hypothetical protein J7474_10135 [Arthrobacter sp.]|nr:hypothetical protein [Arthrobacter sp.]
MLAGHKDRYYQSRLIAAEPNTWSTGLGPVPEYVELAQRWRDLAAEVDAFRDRYNIPETEPTPIPGTLRVHEIGKGLHERVVSMSRAAHASRDHAKDEDLVLDGMNAVEKASDPHAAPSAQAVSDARRAAQESPHR